MLAGPPLILKEHLLFVTQIHKPFWTMLKILGRDIQTKFLSPVCYLYYVRIM